MTNNKTKWLFDSNNDVIEVIKQEYEIKTETSFWEFRPSRILFIKPNRENIDIFQKEYSRFSKSLIYNYYQTDVLKNYFVDEGDDEALEIISAEREIESGVYFPVTNKSSNNLLPQVSFSRNIECPLLKFNIALQYHESFKRLNEVLTKITRVKYEFQLEEILPEIALYQDLEGQSYELSLAIQTFLYKNEEAFKSLRLPSICATGTVTDNGNIGYVDSVDLKLEAANSMGFDYIILPEDCKKDFGNNFVPNNALFFSNLTQVIKWLETFSDQNQYINSIKDWLSGKANKPDAYCFSSFFNTQEKTNIDVWKTLLNGNTNQKIEQLKVLCNEYVQFKAIEPIKPSVFYENCKTDCITHFEDKNLELFNVCLNFWEKYQKNFANQEFLNSQAWQNHLEKEKVLPLLEKESKLLESLEQKVSNVDYLSDSEQFVFEFIRSFANSLEIDCIFRPVIWKNQYSRKLFSTIIIITLSANKDLLSRYIIENIEDLDSLLLSMQYV